MKELFGVPMDYIMYVLLGLLAVSLGSVAVVGLRNQIMFKLGVRNIPRRRAQTTLIILGLMLSTVIIAAAFTTGDTVDRSFTSGVYSVLGSLDETIQFTGDDSEGGFNDVDAPRQQAVMLSEVEPLLTRVSTNPLIDYVIPLYTDLAAAISPAQRLSSPEFNVVGLDPDRARGLPDIESRRGEQLSIDDLAGAEIYVNESAAEELNVGADDTIVLYTLGQPHEFRVRDIVKDRRLAGADAFSGRREGGVMSLSAAQEVFDATGEVTVIAISNRGGAREGIRYADRVESDLRAAVREYRAGSPDAPRLAVGTIKRTGIDIAELLGNLLASFFLVFGLFSIGAGVLLIFLIFVMLAAERKSEMGMARAVGTKRRDLVQTFLSEGMAYNVVAALVGTALGVGVAFVIGKIAAALLARFDVSVDPQVTLRSLIISYSLGVVLTFLTVTFSSWRVSNINIVRAIRDIPDPPPQRPSWGAHGFFATLRRLLLKQGGKKAWVLRLGLFALGIILQGSAGGAEEAAPRALFGTIGALVLLLAVFLTFRFGPMFIIASLPLVLLGANENSAFLLLFGLSLLPLGLAFVARSFGANERIAYTLAGLYLIYIWLFDFSVGLLERVFGKTTGDVEMFFLSGVMITMAATFVLVYNAELFLVPLTKLGGPLGSLLPSLRMAVAYPLANKMRTGMTMAMFCLVVFALTVMSSMNYNFQRLFLSDRSLGGWDIMVEEHPTNPLGDLRTALQSAGSPATSDIESIGVTSIALQGRARACELRDTKLCTPPERDNEGILSSSGYVSYRVWGDDDSFLDDSRIALQARSRGYESDEAVWRALKNDPAFAVVDSSALGGGFAAPLLSGIEESATTFDAVTVSLLDRTTGQTGTVQIIGIIEFGSSSNYAGIHVSKPTFDQVYGDGDELRHYVKTASGTNNVQVSREIESSLLTTGVQAESLRQQADENNATQRGFFLLLQGFMGLGLFVGVAAVGVIAFRTVVERRQQIGMLRALGYTRHMIGMTFLIESAFIAFMGVISGLVFAVILARQLITEQFANQGGASFEVPWLQLAVIGMLAFGFALLMTVIPSRQASRIPIAEALRYE